MSKKANISMRDAKTMHVTVWINDCNVLPNIAIKHFGELEGGKDYIIPAKIFKKIAVDYYASENGVKDHNLVAMSKLIGSDVGFFVAQIWDEKIDPVVTTLQKATDALWMQTPQGIDEATNLLGEANKIIKRRVKSDG